VLEIETIQKDNLVNLASMEQIFNEKKSLMIEMALKKLSVDKWGS